MIPDQIGGKASNQDRPDVGFFRREIFISSKMADYTWHSQRNRKSLWDRIISSATFFSAVFPLYPLTPPMY